MSCPRRRAFCARRVIDSALQPKCGNWRFPEEACAASLCRMRAQAASSQCHASTSCQVSSPACSGSLVVYKTASLPVPAELKLSSASGHDLLLVSVPVSVPVSFMFVQGSASGRVMAWIRYMIPGGRLRAFILRTKKRWSASDHTLTTIRLS